MCRLFECRDAHIDFFIWYSLPPAPLPLLLNKHKAFYRHRPWCCDIVFYSLCCVSITCLPVYMHRVDTYRWTQVNREAHKLREITVAAVRVCACCVWGGALKHWCLTTDSLSSYYYPLPCMEAPCCCRVFFWAQLNYSGNNSIANYSFPLERRHRLVGLSC